MFPHLHSQLCLPDAPTPLNSSVGLDVKGEAERRSSVRRPSCAYFQTPWSRSCLSHKPQLSVLYPFIQVLFLAQTFKQRHLFTAPFVLLHLGPLIHSSVAYVYEYFTHNVWLAELFVVLVVVDREKPVSGETHHKGRVDFSMLPESQFYPLLRYWMHSGEADQSALSCLLATKWAEQQIHRAESQSVTEPRPRRDAERCTEGCRCQRAEAAGIL